MSPASSATHAPSRTPPPVSGAGAQAGLRLDHVRDLPDGPWPAVATRPGQRQSHKRRQRAAARAAADPGGDAVVVRVVQYTVPDRDGEEIRLVTSILDPADAPAGQPARAYHEPWEAETGIGRTKPPLRGPGRVLRPRTPELAYQETWAYLLTHWAVVTLICHAATAAGIGPDRIKFLGTLHILRRSVTDRGRYSGARTSGCAAAPRTCVPRPPPATEARPRREDRPGRGVPRQGAQTTRSVGKGTGEGGEPGCEEAWSRERGEMCVRSRPTMAFSMP